MRAHYSVIFVSSFHDKGPVILYLCFRVRIVKRMKRWRGFPFKYSGLTLAANEKKYLLCCQSACQPNSPEGSYPADSQHIWTGVNHLRSISTLLVKTRKKWLEVTLWYTLGFRIRTMLFIFLIFSGMPVATVVPQQVFSTPHPITAQTQPPPSTHTHTQKNVPWGTTSCCSDRYGELPKYFYHQNLAYTHTHSLSHTPKINTVRLFTRHDFFQDAFRG